MQHGETSCVSVILHGHRVVMKLATFILYRVKSRPFCWESDDNRNQSAVVLSRIIWQPLTQQQPRILNTLFSVHHWLCQLKCQLAWDWKTRNHEKRGMLTAQSPHSLVLWWQQASHGADRQSECMVGFHPKLGSNINGILGRLIYSMIYDYINNMRIVVQTIDYLVNKINWHVWQFKWTWKI